MSYFDPLKQKQYLVGVTSLEVNLPGEGSCPGPARYPGIYARVNSSLDWIKKIVGKDLCQL